MREQPTDDDLQPVVKALNHPLRCRLLRWQSARERPGSPTEASVELEVPLPEVAYHVRVLARAGLLADAGQEPTGGSIQHFYRLDTDRAELPVVAHILGEAD